MSLELAEATVRILPTGQFSSLNNVTIVSLISAFVIFSLIIASLSFVFTLIFGGIRWIVSGGKNEKVDEAKNQIVNALIGLLIIFSAWAIINFVSVFFGVELMTFNIPNLQQ